MSTTGALQTNIGRPRIPRIPICHFCKTTTSNEWWRRAIMVNGVRVIVDKCQKCYYPRLSQNRIEMLIPRNTR
ncbi:expressed protein [Dictyostelium purpureum]|uniref:Expressed protein n=1 Tax=Dictyostelium purpureum TaxID=5786 RepID=F0ZIJ1_DICPU|nr:uncharacterized protein DICPUDRAFT_94358 [Dictyostelium purpureum]EGC36224.1 expressed protein [Dictyostelium purpureum]|eukprot:XP_003287233.1 expressed protein [Dictyostelium purpureum]